MPLTIQRSSSLCTSVLLVSGMIAAYPAANAAQTSSAPAAARSTASPPTHPASKTASAPPPAAAHPEKGAEDSNERGDKSDATLDETLKWLQTKATFHEDGVGVTGVVGPLPSSASDNGDDSDAATPAPTIGTLIFSTDQKLTYDAANHQLVVQQRAARPGSPALEMVTTLPLDKLGLTASLDHDDPNAVVVSCLPTSHYFHEVGTLMGQRTDDFVGEVTVRFNSVNTAERAVRAFQHLASLTSGKGPTKPAGEPF